MNQSQTLNVIHCLQKHWWPDVEPEMMIRELEHRGRQLNVFLDTYTAHF